MNREPRPLCTRCRRPPAVCYCAELTLLPTKTRVVLLQHPRERDNAIGTAWMASLCLPNSELHVGIRWNQQSAMAAAITNPAAPAVLLYPGADAKDILLDPPQGPVTLVVVDGTWSQAKTLVRDNPILAALPRYAFSAPVPSEYRIRKEPSDEVVSTIESLMYALGALEGETETFTALLKPFRAMVNTQLGFNAGKRARKKKRVAKVVPPSAALLLLRQRWDDVVCVVGEVNAWPYQMGRHRDRDELAHWVAVRPSTGEQFVGLATPTYDWSPSTPKNLGLDPARLQTARPRHELYQGFAQFVRPTDIVCGWSWYSPRLFSAGEHVIDAPIFNIRVLLEEVLHRRMPRLESYAAELAPLPPGPEGRAGQRLATLVAAVRCCVETPLVAA
ncbi:MAG: DTW domain-containing protein [Kofleriaceae bacterium]|nr:DTW domain-containing protein [Kofleriaceae bacterium]